jgi:DNA-binding LytR/AlgR family response regulator
MAYSAIIADDEQELRLYLRALLSEVWPGLEIRGEAGNGKEVLDLVESMHPDVAFLDIKMPGLSGMEAARRIAGVCRVVFVTAYDRYAVEAFERQAVDYLLKPVSKERLARTVRRLQDQLAASLEPPPGLAEAVEQVLARLPAVPGRTFLRWIRTQQTDQIRLIPVEEVDYFKAEDKYTVVVAKEAEFLIRKGIRELSRELDPDRFWQIHRAFIVNVASIEKMSRSLTGRGVLKLKGRPELLTVGRSYLHLFRQM